MPAWLRDPAPTAGQQVLTGGHAYFVAQVDPARGRLYVHRGQTFAWLPLDALSYDQRAAAWRTDRELVDGIPGQAAAWPELDE